MIYLTIQYFKYSISVKKGMSLSQQLKQFSILEMKKAYSKYRL